MLFPFCLNGLTYHHIDKVNTMKVDLIFYVKGLELRSGY